MAGTDDDLLSLLGEVLAPPDREPPPDRVGAVRAAAHQRRLASGSQNAEPIQLHRVGLDRLNRWVLAAAAAVLAILAGSVSLAVAGGGDKEVAGEVEFDQSLLDRRGAVIGTVTGTKVPFGRIVSVQTDELEVLPTGEYYEVWFLDPSTITEQGVVARISAGTFHPDDQGRTSVDLFAAVDPAKHGVLAITVEPGDGDPTPSPDEVVRIELSLE